MAARSGEFPGWPDHFYRALRLIPQHRQVLDIGTPATVGGGGMEVDVTFRVNLPNAWRVIGVSPNGVRREEVVRFHFPPRYPVDAPFPSLREDFDRSHPHMQPDLFGGRPLPCIAELSLSSLLHQQGLRGILNQTALWLDNAALGTLIDSRQGWEPARRDELSHAITADADVLRANVTRHAGHRYFPFLFAALELQKGGRGVRGQLDSAHATVNPSNIHEYFALKNHRHFAFGRSLALLVWPGKHPDGRPVVCDQYQPDSVSTLEHLLHQARFYGCEKPLEQQLRYLAACIGDQTLSPHLPLAIILCVRRPMPLIGSASDIELCGYITSCSDLSSKNWDCISVAPAAHNQAIGAELCRRLSGTKASEECWTLVGAGSLGSKIALHLTRQGMAPSHIVDRSIMRAHNAVRHGLLPNRTGLDGIWTNYKADMLCESISGFAQSAEPVHEDIGLLTYSDSGLRRFITKSTTSIVNSAASIRVREVLAALPAEKMGARIIETSLFSSGGVALVTAEGQFRHPNTGDLISEFYRLAAATPSLQAVLFADGSDLTRVSIGEGCGSATMVLSDAKLSAYAAGMAQIVADEVARPAKEADGGLWIAENGKDGISIAWSHHAAPAVTTVSAENLSEWTVRLTDRVETAMRNDIALWPGVETGGILMGRLSEVSRTFYVVDLLPAPPDSERSAAHFKLGVKGVKSMLKSYSERCGWSLYCLGTWHTHLGSSTPSGLDKSTARSVALARITPSLLLIKAPTGYSALVADAAASDHKT